MKSKKIIIDANFPNETRVVLLNGYNIEDIECETTNKQQNKGNIYLAKITRVEPSLQAAFIDYGTDKSGFLSFNEIHPDYYHIPVSDQKTSISNLKEIAPPKITQADLAESQIPTNYNLQMDNEELDIKAIEKLVDEKIQSEFNLEAGDNDIENINPSKIEINGQHKQYKIQEVIKKGQIMLVQVTKEERGNKGASFTTFISLAGKYCVLMPNKPAQNGISRKISNADERKRLKNIISLLTSNSEQGTASVIARTAAIGHTTLEIKRDYDYLVRLWNKIREATLQSSAPSFIHEEEGIIQKTIRDIFDNNVKELIIQGEKAFQAASKFMKEILPSETNRIKEDKSKTPIFTKFNVEDQLSNLYQPIVNLSSGGYIVINPTEALISIDVNSGKATSERNIEETALKTNLEAAKEIARQVKLRDLSGLLVIDFIDMYELRNRKIIERSLKEFFSRDRARIQIGNISSFGLLEMSRQRMRPSFSESNSSICSYCNGKGLVRADESNSMLILRTVENEIFNDNVDVVNVYTNTPSGLYLLNNKRTEIKFIEEKYNLKLNIYFDPTATSDSYSLEKIKLPKRNQHTNVSNKPTTKNNFNNNQEMLVNGGKTHWKQEQKTNNELTKVPIEEVLTINEEVKEKITNLEVNHRIPEGELNNQLTETVNTPINSRKRINKRSHNRKKPMHKASLVTADEQKEELK